MSRLSISAISRPSWFNNNLRNRMAMDMLKSASDIKVKILYSGQ